MSLRDLVRAYLQARAETTAASAKARAVASFAPMSDGEREWVQLAQAARAARHRELLALHALQRGVEVD